MHYVVLFPQNGDRIATIDSVMSLHPVYTRFETTSILSRDTDHSDDLTVTELKLEARQSLTLARPALP